MHPQCFNFERKFQKKVLESGEIESAQATQKNKDKIQQFVHSYLFCRDKDEVLTTTQAKVVENERKKYLDFLKKNFKYKIPSQFLSRKAMKEKMKELKKQKLQKKQKQKQEQEQKQKKQKKIKKPTKPQPKVTKKEKKTQKKQEKQKEKIQPLKEEPEMKEISPELAFESEMDLANDDLDDIQNDDQ